MSPFLFLPPSCSANIIALLLFQKVIVLVKVRAHETSSYRVCSPGTLTASRVRAQYRYMSTLSRSAVAVPLRALQFKALCGGNCRGKHVVDRQACGSFILLRNTTKELSTNYQLLSSLTNTLATLTCYCPCMVSTVVSVN